MVVGVALAAAFAPGTAVAKSRYFVQDPALKLSMSLRGSHGYRISIDNFGQTVVLTASKGATTAKYLVQGKVSAAGINASFGDLGQISVGFHSSAHSSKPPAGTLPLECKGKSPIREVGSFHGRIRFDGEMGFTALSAGRAKGSLTRNFRRVCKRPPWLAPNGQPKPVDPIVENSISSTILAAASRTDGHFTTVLFANIEAQVSPKEPGIFLALARAQLRERHDGVRINRSAEAEGNAGSLLTSAPGVTPATATLTLPSPFTGTASYSKTPGSKPSWTGSLRVELPGAGTVPLTEPEFTAVLCEGTQIATLKRCLHPVQVASPDSHGAVIARPQ